MLKELAQKQNKSRHTVIVDNTSNDTVANAYPAFLQAGFSVVTPNKKAYSGSDKLFQSILSSLSPSSSPSSAQAPPLVYLESTVGAGLPIISTLKDLVATGDEIEKIEGVLSGTLSYIFNVWCPPSLDSTAKFSEVVKVAKENGYTVSTRPSKSCLANALAAMFCSRWLTPQPFLSPNNAPTGDERSRTRATTCPARTSRGSSPSSRA